MNLYHPLLNQPLPTVADLRSRCVDAESVEVLDVACRFAAERCSRFDVVHVASEDYSADPYIGERLKLGTAPKLQVTETDIIRSLLACQPMYLETALFEAIRTFMQPSGMFFSGADHWKSVKTSCQPEELPTVVSTRWGRRWALLFLENPDQEIRLSTWLLSVMDLIPPNFNNLFCSGIITETESQVKMEIAFHRHLKGLPGPTRWNFPELPPAYYDRHGLLNAANDLLTSSNGIFLIGPDYATLRSLLRAISWNVNYCPQMQALGAIQQDGGRYFSPESVNLQAGPDSPASVFALTGNVPEGVGGPAWCIDRTEVAFASIVNESLGFFRWLTEEAINSKIRFVIMMAEDEWETLIKEVPAVTGIPVLHVPTRDERDLVPTLLAELPAIVDRHDCLVPFGLLLNFLCQTAQANPALLPDMQATTFRGLIRHQDTNLGLLNTSPFQELHRTPFSRLDNGNIPIRIRERFVQKMIAESGDFFVRYIGDTADLDALMVLYESVVSLKDPDPTPRVLGTDSTNGRSRPTSPALAENDPHQGRSYSSSESQKSARSYAEVIQDLPRPTRAQTARFASFVAEAHSWYKKLPLYPKTPFFFYLDPAAGMKIQSNATGSGNQYVDEVGQGIHYSDMTTKVYRENFGYWNYHVDINAKMLEGFQRIERGDEIHEGFYPEANICNVNGQKLIVAPELMLKGMAKLSAFVHSDSPLHLWLDDIEALKSHTPFTFARTLERAPKDILMPFRQIWAFLNTPNWYPILDSEILTPYNAFVSTLAGEASVPTRWHHDDLLRYQAERLGGIHLYEDVLFAVEIVRTIESRTQAFEFHRGNSSESEIKKLVDHLVIERMQQIQTMKDAMNSFVENLYS